MKDEKDIYSLIRVVAFTQEGKEYEYYAIEDDTLEVACFVGTYQECIAYEKSHPINNDETLEESEWISTLRIRQLWRSFCR